MGVIDLSAYKPTVSTLGDANQIRNGFSALEAVINGGIDNNNFAAGKIFDPLKLMQDAATAGQALVWNAAANGGTGGWVPGSISPGLYRKITSKQVLNTVTETDLLNGEITLGAGVLGTNGLMRLSAWGDYVCNPGAGTLGQRFKLKLGGTTLIDTGASAAGAQGNSATRFGWRVTATIQNTATNVQVVYFDAIVTTQPFGATASANNAFTTGEGTVVNFTSVATTFANLIYSGYNAGAVDTTAACALVLSVINPSAGPTYDTTLKGALVEVL